MKNEINHIAFIMDGNGRWAKNQNLDRLIGHEKGAKQIGTIIDGCISHNIKYISFFAFSTENWKRPKSEIFGIMKLLKEHIGIKNIDWFNKRKIKLNVVGFKNNISSSLSKKMDEMQEATKNNKDVIVNIFFNYGGMQEIVNACNEAILNGKKISVKSFEKLLLTKDMPNVDLLIRTSGEHRISNFMLWQIAYAEIIFENTLWPDYDISTLEKNLVEYDKRTRRYGGI
ncbi:MAG: polyprenyl diphosphate synthase [Mycoplasma sp.]